MLEGEIKNQGSYRKYRVSDRIVSEKRRLFFSRDKNFDPYPSLVFAGKGGALLARSS